MIDSWGAKNMRNLKKIFLQHLRVGFFLIFCLCGLAPKTRRLIIMWDGPTKLTHNSYGVGPSRPVFCGPKQGGQNGLG